MTETVPTTNDNNQDLKPLIRVGAVAILISHAINVGVSALIIYPHAMRATVDQLTSLLHFASDLLFSAGAVFLLMNKSRGLKLLKWAAIAKIAGHVIGTIYIFVVNGAEGILPNVYFTAMSLTKFLIWPVFVLWLVFWQELKKHLN